MENTREVIQVALDAIHGNKYANYSAEQTSDKLREAFIQMNGGSSKFDLKNFYPGSELFTVVQNIIPAIIHESILNDPTLMSLVEYINIAEGDVNEFVTEGQNFLVVSKAAKGIRDVRRQRIADGEAVRVPTFNKVIRIYEPLTRLLAKRVDFNKFVDEVGLAFKREMALDAYGCLDGITSATPGLSESYVISGAFNEEKLLEVIERVEAATGKSAKIVGTKAALRKIKTAEVSDEAKNDLYNFGYYGKFCGTPMIAMKQSFKPGSDEAFALSATKVFILAGDDKPIKLINVGDGLLKETAGIDTADMTQEYVYMQETGAALILGNKIGVDDINE